MTSTAAGSGSTGLQRRNLKTTISLCVAVWVLSGLISIPPLIGWKTTDLYTYDAVHDRAQCILFNTEGYVLYSASGSFIIPSIFIVIVYGKIFQAYTMWIRKRKTQLTGASQPAAAAATRATRTTKPGVVSELHKTTTSSSISRRNNSQSSNASTATPVFKNPNNTTGESYSKINGISKLKLNQKSQTSQRNVLSSSLRSRNANDEEASHYNDPSSSLNDNITPGHQMRVALDVKSPKHEQGTSSMEATSSSASEEHRRLSSHSTSPSAVGAAPGIVKFFKYFSSVMLNDLSNFIINRSASADVVFAIQIVIQ